MPPIDPAWIALIGTLCGGLGLKVVEHWLGKSQRETTDAKDIRAELRQQITDQKEEIRALEVEVDKWRMQYLDLRDKYTHQQTELLIALQQLKAQQQAVMGPLPQPIDPSAEK